MNPQEQLAEIATSQRDENPKLAAILYAICASLSDPQGFEDLSEAIHEQAKKSYKRLCAEISEI